MRCSTRPTRSPFDFAALQDPENARLHLNPALRLVASRWPILDIWQANQAEDVPRIRLEERRAWLAVLRRGLQPAVEPLSAGEFALLDAMQARLTLGEACAAAAAAEPALELAAAMRRFVHLGLFSKEG
jgi:hypothetical protein